MNRIRLLLPVDPEDDCVDAMRLIEALVPKRGVDLLRVYVYRPAEADLYAPEMYIALPATRRLSADEEAVVKDVARRSCRAMSEAGYKVEYEIVGGDPASQIQRDVDDWGADLIVTRKSNEKRDELHLGVLTTALIESSRVPVLMHRRVREGFAVRKIAAVIDARGEKQSGLQWAARWSEMLGAELHFVQPLVGDEEPSDPAAVIDELRLQPSVRDKVHRAPGSTLVQAVTTVVKREECDLVVVSARQHKARTVLSADDRKIIRESQLPVLMIPERSNIDPRAFVEKAAQHR